MNAMWEFKRKFPQLNIFPFVLTVAETGISETGISASPTWELSRPKRNTFYRKTSLKIATKELKL